MSVLPHSGLSLFTESCYTHEQLAQKSVFTGNVLAVTGAQAEQHWRQGCTGYTKQSKGFFAARVEMGTGPRVLYGK